MIQKEVSHSEMKMNKREEDSKFHFKKDTKFGAKYNNIPEEDYEESEQD
jgi:hypothetical protein